MNPNELSQHGGARMGRDRKSSEDLEGKAQRTFPAPFPNSFYLMIDYPEVTTPAHDKEGMLLVCPDDPIESGKPVLVSTENGPVARLYIEDPITIELQELNPEQVPTPYRPGMTLLRIRGYYRED